MDILNQRDHRESLIKQFQDKVWNDDECIDLFRELAYDLDYYEPNPDYRSESSEFFGDEDLEKLIELTLLKL